MFVGSFFFLNVFVGIVISSFNREKEELGGLSILSEKQREFIEIQIMVLESKPIRRPKTFQDFIKKPKKSEDSIESPKILKD